MDVSAGLLEDEMCREEEPCCEPPEELIAAFSNFFVERVKAVAQEIIHKELTLYRRRSFLLSYLELGEHDPKAEPQLDRPCG